MAVANIAERTTRADDATSGRDLWARIAAPLPEAAVSWRQDGKPTARDGKFFARVVAYIDAHTVRERLDAVVPGEWDLSLEPLPPFVHADGTLNEDAAVSFKARLQILGVIRECVGSGPNYKEAATDAFKRAAVRFGVGHELYHMGQCWVQVDGDGRYAKPVEDPWVAYRRRNGSAPAQREESAARNAADLPARPAAPASAPSAAASGDDVPPCPKCGGRTWDNRLSKRNPKAPDFKCRDRNCDGVIWPPRDGQASAPKSAPAESDDDFPAALADEDDTLPF